MMACGAAPIWLHDAVRVGHFAAKDVNIWNESKFSTDAENSVHSIFCRLQLVIACNGHIGKVFWLL